MKRLYKHIHEELKTIEVMILGIKSNLQKVYQLKENKEYQTCLWALRNSLEDICRNLYTNEISQENEILELRQIIKKLEANSIIPSHILPHVRSVQTFGNYGAHSQIGINPQLDENYIQPAIASMEIICTWFTKEYHGFQCENDKNDLANLLKYYPYYEEDKSAHHVPWVTDKYVNANTIIIALGTHTCFELFDRIPAELLRKNIDENGDYNQRKRAIIVTDIWYFRDKSLQTNKIISIGKKDTNLVTNHLLKQTPCLENAFLSTQACTVFNSKNNLIFSSEMPAGSLEAILKFIKSEIGLKKFLAEYWG